VKKSARHNTRLRSRNRPGKFLTVSTVQEL
jgi:hypothetical protein